MLDILQENYNLVSVFIRLQLKSRGLQKNPLFTAAYIHPSVYFYVAFCHHFLPAL